LNGGNAKRKESKMSNLKQSELAKAISVTVALCSGGSLSNSILGAYVQQLSEYDSRAVLVALKRCQGEVKGHVSLAHIIERIDDGHPGEEEAFAMLPRSEADSVVWTPQIAAAWAAASNLQGDRTAYRMAFREAYRRQLVEARGHGEPIRWCLSAGSDEIGRDGALQKAVDAGRMAPQLAAKYSPTFKLPGTAKQLTDGAGLGTDEIRKITGSLVKGMEVEG
jgi:hypothetical protein